MSHNDDPGAESQTPEAEAATKQLVFNAAERLFALHGFQNVSVRDITASRQADAALEAARQRVLLAEDNPVNQKLAIIKKIPQNYMPPRLLIA